MTGEAPSPYYHCLRCRRPLRFADVVTMGVVVNDSFYLAHECWCTPDYIFERTFQVNHPAMRTLLGGFRPTLPYSAVPAEPQPLRGHQERLLAIFRWECEALESVEEFLLFATRPHQVRAVDPPVPKD